MAMSSAHTPAPWRLVARKEGWAVKAAEGCVLAGVSRFSGGTRMSECEPNARLIAAAPELYKACQRALAVLMAMGVSTKPDNVLGALVAALNRAEGRS